MAVPKNIVERDKKNACKARECAHTKLIDAKIIIPKDDITGARTRVIEGLKLHHRADHKSLIAIYNQPFHAMAEVETLLKDGRMARVVWYAHEDTAIMQELDGVKVLPWTHPGIQIAISHELNDEHSFNDPRFGQFRIKPISRAKYSKVFPEIEGIYDPGGQVGYMQDEMHKTGLKAVKLHMTRDQVHAFVSKMKGVLFVTGAPGSGKTTVAFQRMRFLFDQGEQQTDIEHKPEQSKVFLANQNLIDYSKDLLEEHLGIQSSIVSLVEDFVADYLNDAWRYKSGALYLSHESPDKLNHRAREAFFSTCVSDDLRNCWRSYEEQVVERMLKSEESEWAQLELESVSKNNLKDILSKIIGFATKHNLAKRASEPLFSELRMDRLYQTCSVEYERLRDGLSRKDVESFDGLFLKWLFFVYDPLDALIRYFANKKHDGAERILRGTGSRVNEDEVVHQIFVEWAKRRYRSEELAWLAWLLRFALPTAIDPKDRFREVPNGLSPIAEKYGPWNHVVIDEAQDLSVAEASFISSFTIKNGALTISADFKQVVSPVHGMTDPSAFRIGCPLLDKGDEFNRFPFTKNMRQTAQIGKFLKGFYERAFGETPQFDANEELPGPKPQLHLLPFSQYAITLKRALNVIKQKGFSGAIAMIQINENEDEMIRLRKMLEKESISLAPIWASKNGYNHLITTSVERIKGLEYDICFVIGMENAENERLNYNKNRVYVSLSRPTQRLYMLCEHFPVLLRHVQEDLFEQYDMRNI